MMELTIGSLWLAILLSAAIVWAVSALVWMVLPHHKSDFKGLPDEDAAIAGMRAQNIPPGQYNIPHCATMEEYKKPEALEKFNKGPVVYMTVVPNGYPQMGGKMALSFVYYIVVGIIIAYILTRTLPADAEYLAVFRLTGVVAWMTYGFGAIPECTWFGKPWSWAIKAQFDALLYALLTAGVFGWQWISLNS